MKLFKMTAVVIALLLGLSACSGMKERIRKSVAAQAEGYRNQCTAMGFTAGTDAFLLCLDNRRMSDEVRRATHQARMKAIWDD